MARGYRALWIWVVIEDAVVRKKPEQQVLHSAYPIARGSRDGAPSRSVQDDTCLIDRSECKDVAVRAVVNNRSFTSLL